MPYRPFHSQNRVEYIKQKFENSISEENKALKCSKSVPLKTPFLTNPKDDNEKTENGKTEGKALIKRTPAFRRDKLGCAKSLSKIPNQKTEAQVDDGINDWKALQRSKTDLNLKCDINGKEIKPLNENTQVKYSVVNKKCKQKEVDLKLSESIRRALQSPLPKGPPPKKPPRTFCHVPQNEKPKTDIPKLKSKLEKLEKVIKDHKIGVKEEFRIDLEKKLNRIPETISSSKKNDNQSCLLFSNCLTLKNPHVYEKLMKKNSEFYFDLSKSDSKSLGCAMSEETNDSKPCVPVKRCSSEPIYDLPCVTKKFETFGKCDRKEEEKNKKTEGLHYMCTDVVKTVPVFPNFSSSFGRRKSLEGDTKPKIPARGKPVLGSMSKSDDKPVEKLVDNLTISGEKSNCLGRCDSSSSGSDIDFSTKVPDGKGCKSGLGGETRSESEEAEDLSQMTAKRKVYVSRVSSKLLNKSPYWKCNNKNSHTHLFECCMLVGLTLCESKKNVPYIKSIFPPEVKPPPLIEFLCFPDASHWPPSSENQQPEEQYYSLVVTNEYGDRKFGYCRRVLPEGGHFCLPLTYCIISPHRANGFFYKVLEELESRHGSPGVENFIKQLYESQFPGPGERLKLKEILEEATRTTLPNSDGYASSTLLRRPCDVRLEEKDLNQLFEHLHLTVLIKVFSSLLHERKVLLFSSSLRKLSSCIEALHSILLPFLWQHTYIPVLPVHLIEMCEAPTPYVIGLLKTKNVEESLANLNFEDGILVDLDDSKIIKCCGDEGSILPPKFIRDLKMALNLAKTATDLSDSIRNVLISDAFIRFFVQVCGNYSKFIFSHSNGEKVFEKEEFIKSFTSNTTQSFLEWFTETAMFHSFIQERLHGEVEDVLVKLFRLRALEHETMKNSTVLLKNYKVINKKVRTLGDRIKDLTSFSK